MRERTQKQAKELLRVLVEAEKWVMLNYYGPVPWLDDATSAIEGITTEQEEDVRVGHQRQEEEKTMQITLNVRNVDTVPGTSKWFAELLQERNARLEFATTRAKSPAAYLVLDSQEERDGKKLTAYKCLAMFTQYGHEEPKVYSIPFLPDEFDRGETLDGALLSKGATNILYTLAGKAAELLEQKMREEDATVAPESVNVAVA